MASTKLTETPEKGGRFLKPDHTPEIILDSDGEESENDNTETVNDEDYELGPDQSLLQ
jgi:hypothetical protein